ncbi:MAG: aminoglycoside phosphotransferase family protein [Ktedonobacteraceae bacterium]
MMFIPENFKQDMLIVHGEEKASAWLASLPAILAHCAERWQLTIFPPFPNLSFHYVAPAERADGTPVVVKVVSPTGEFAEEVEALHLFQDGGMVRLLEVDFEREVMLLERLLPGTLLSQLVPEQDERAISILISVMKRIWRPAPAQHVFPTVENWGKGLERLRTQYDGGYGPFPPRLVQEAEDLFSVLNASAPQHMLLHGDLHHENILLAGNEWRAIDPKGVVGDPGYETGVLFYNPMPVLFHVPDVRTLLARRVDQLAEELGMERARIRGWGLAQSVLSAWWHMEDDPTAELPHDVLACAEILAGMKIE